MGTSITNQYSSASNITDSTAGQVTLQATSSWYNTSWAYRRSVPITNAGSAQTNFQVAITIDTATLIAAGKMQSDCDDIRITDLTNILLPQWIEKGTANCNTSTTKIWTQVSSVPTSGTSLYIYYGNSSAVNVEQPTQVFDYFENFESYSSTANIISAGWVDLSINGAFMAYNATNGSNSSKAILLDPQTGSGWKRASTYLSGRPFSSETVLEYFYKATNDNYYDGPSGFSDRTTAVTETTNGADGTNMVVFDGNSSSPNDTFKTKSAGTQTSVAANVGRTGSHKVSIYWGSTSRFYFDGTQIATSTTNIPSASLNIFISQFPQGVDAGVGYFDDLRTRKYASIEPSVGSPISEESVYSIASGSLTSSIFDTEFSAGAVWGTLTYNATTPSNTSVSVKARTSNSSSMTGATAFSSCTAITSGSDISSNSCVTDTHRYIQYQLTLANTDSVSTPTFQDLSIAFVTYDATAPTISLTALATDPNSDTTPTLSGTATEGIGTVSNVQFQMDSTSGSWTTCTASDGSFNSASEAFTCTPSALSDGSHTMYVRTTDSNSNTTASGSYASDTFTIDATNPVSIDLDSPGGNSYTNSDRPTFKWKATTDATAGLSKYVLEIDNPSIGSSQPSGDFTIDNIPTSRTTDYETNKYVIKYDNFSDSDSTNNYISIYTKSSSEWSSDSNSGQNDGKLREGKVSWKVKAVDNASNETSSSRTLFVDRTKPGIEDLKVNGTTSGTGSFTSTDTTPTISARLKDTLAGGDSSKTQDEYGPRVASGLGKAEVKIEKKQGLGYKLITLYTVNFDKPKYSCDDKELSDNTKQKCDKYSSFEYTPENNLDLGQYKITLSGKDKADNSSSETTLTLNITTLAKITNQLQPTPEESDVPLRSTLPPSGEAPVPDKEGNITIPVEPHALEKATSVIPNLIGNLYKSGTAWIPTFVGMTKDGINKIASPLRGLAMTIDNSILFVFTKTGDGLAFVGNGIGTGLHNTGETIGSGFVYVGHGVGNTGKAIGDEYNQLANNAPGVTKTILTGIGNGVSSTVRGVQLAPSEVSNRTSRFARRVTDGTGNIVRAGARTTGDIASSVTNTTSATVKNTGSTIANLAFTVGEKTDDVSHEFGTTIIKIGYLFVPEPTKISDVKVAKSTPTSMTISWETNHPANGKVNYGLTADYGQDVQSDKRITKHEFTVTGLEPNTTYYYEVMSHNRNYVYDANHTFTTPAE